MEPTQGRFDLIPTQLAMTAMRDNGYKNAAYALAELIDNSIQAGARNVEVLCSEREQRVSQRNRRRIHQIAVLDNGSGMDADTLRIALQFGNGSRLDDRSGMGRFGMGLPNASISQCRKVEVWTWKAGIDNAIHTYIDLDEVDQGEMVEVPEPAPRDVPATWFNAATATPGFSGTLIVWSELDRCSWKTARAIIENSELLVGRMYRRFIADGRATIRMAAFEHGRPTVIDIEKNAEINDPIYRMKPSSTPEPFNNRPMFEPYGDTHWEYPQVFEIEGQKVKAIARFTIATEEARHRSESGQSAGDLPHGQHAKNNVGVSVIRADREIELSLALVDPSEPRDRWWGVEIEFPPELDEIFGVTNNKQSARTLSEMLNTPLESLLDDGQTEAQFKEQLHEENDPRLGLIELSDRVRKNLQSMRGLIRAQQKGSSRRKRHDGDTAERRGTTATRKLQEEGHGGRSDSGEELPAQDREQKLETAMVQEAGLTHGDAHELARGVVEEGLKYVFVDSPMESSAFFSVSPRAGAIMLTLNTQHPVYEHLIEILERDVSGTAEDRLSSAREGLKLLLEAWARYEDELPEGPRRDAAMDARNDWGRVARRFFAT